MHNIRRIAVFRALFLGDLLVATPALRALRQRFAHAEITLIGLAWARELLGRLPGLDRLLVFPGYPGIAEQPYDPARSNAFLAHARADNYDLAIQLHGDGSASNGFVAELGARLSLGYARPGDTRLSLSLPYQDGEHETRRWLRLLDLLEQPRERAVGELQLLSAGSSQLSLIEPQLTPEFQTQAEDHQRAAALLDAFAGSGPLVALHVGAKDPARRWPLERFAALADALYSRYGAQILLTGSAGEAELSRQVAQAIQAPAYDLAGATDLGMLAALLQQIDLLVTNDTGASHMASAVGTPSVVLFGPSRPEQWAPLDQARHRVIDAPQLLGWSDRAAALAALPVAEVLAVCEEMLEALCAGSRS